MTSHTMLQLGWPSTKPKIQESGMKKEVKWLNLYTCKIFVIFVQKYSFSADISCSIFHGQKIQWCKAFKWSTCCAAVILWYCPHQFTWCIHFIVMILVWSIMVLFMQWDSKASIHGPSNSLCGIHFIVTCTHCSYCAYNEEIILLTGLLNTACTECYTNLPPYWPQFYKKPR
jgi:hypothetical protein